MTSFESLARQKMWNNELSLCTFSLAFIRHDLCFLWQRFPWPWTLTCWRRRTQTWRKTRRTKKLRSTRSLTTCCMAAVTARSRSLRKVNYKSFKTFYFYLCLTAVIILFQRLCGVNMVLDIVILNLFLSS